MEEFWNLGGNVFSDECDLDQNNLLKLAIFKFFDTVTNRAKWYYPFCDDENENLFKWGSIRCKHIAREQHLSQIKARLLWLDENVFSPIKTQQATSGTSAATYKLMEPHWLEAITSAEHKTVIAVFISSLTYGSKLRRFKQLNLILLLAPIRCPYSTFTNWLCG